MCWFCVGAALYRKLKAYLMTEEQLQEHSYPRAGPVSSGRAVIHNQPERKALADGEWSDHHHTLMLM